MPWFIVLLNTYLPRREVYEQYPSYVLVAAAAVVARKGASGLLINQIDVRGGIHEVWCKGLCLHLNLQGDDHLTVCALRRDGYGRLSIYKETFLNLNDVDDDMTIFDTALGVIDRLD